MKKLTLILAVIALSITMFSCSGGSSDSKPTTKKEAAVQQPITMDNLIGEWECVDITNGVTHMESIAKMQPHIVFNKKNEVFFKTKLPDSSFVSQKAGSFSIEKGKLVSDLFEENLYLGNDNLIMEQPSTDDKRIYKKIK